MKTARGAEMRGFTLIELLTALIILSLLALMSYRGLDAVLESREYVKRETEKWRRVTLFLDRFGRDVRLAAPRPIRAGPETVPALHGKPNLTPEGKMSPYLEFSRFGWDYQEEAAQRVAYRLNHKQEIELWLWPGLDIGPNVSPARYTVLTGVRKLDLEYLSDGRVWVNTWPEMDTSLAPGASSIPLAVRLRMVLASGEEILRIFR